jgi:multidrug resistance efflux pump
MAERRGGHYLGGNRRFRPRHQCRERQPNGQGLANVNPIFTWVRLAQRIPVRIHIDEVSEGVVLAAGLTATVQINPQLRTLPE